MGIRVGGGEWPPLNSEGGGGGGEVKGKEYSQFPFFLFAMEGKGGGRVGWGGGEGVVLA